MAGLNFNGGKIIFAGIALRNSGSYFIFMLDVAPDFSIELSNELAIVQILEATSLKFYLFAIFACPIHFCPLLSMVIQNGCKDIQ
jgi:hypothetical protein